MCGIHGSTENHERFVLDMARQASHRGPDQTNVKTYNGTVTLGHNRLSIVDLSATGNQPMTTQNGRFTVVFNGEIYNAQELKQELLQHGITFKGTSDTEVLLYAYEQWGSGCIEKLRGMWAFAIYDQHNQTMFLSRDPFGIKPLYFYHTPNDFIFSSEIRSLLSHPHIKKIIDKTAVQDLLLFGHIIAPRTIVEHIRALLPGEQLTYSVSKKTATKTIAPLHATTKEAPSDKELKETLIDSVKHHLIADVPIGLFLSGGIDSSLLAIILKEMKVHLHAFSVEIEGKKDYQYAKQVADACDIPLSKLTLSVQEIERMIPELLQHMDQPLADSSLLPTMAVSKLAAQQVKVVLSGEGGDELFAGYARAKRLSGLSADIDRSIVARGYSALLRHLFPLLPRHFPLHMARGLLRRLETIRGDTLGLFVTETAITSILIDATSAQQRIEERVRERETPDRGLAFDRLINLPDKLLLKADMATMAYSLEGRVPLLDKKLFSLVGGAPNEWKQSNHSQKAPLRRLLSHNLPTSFFDRPKEGFSIPITQLLKNKTSEMKHALEWYQKNFKGMIPTIDTTIQHALNKGLFDEMFALMRYSYYALFILEAFTDRYSLSS